MENILWSTDESISTYDFEQPKWITEDLDCSQVAAIIQGGCASGAYMPAVTYYIASQTMAKHGDEVLEYIVEKLGELPEVPKGESWSGISVFFLSYAVELYCQSIEEELEQAIEEETEDAE